MADVNAEIGVNIDTSAALAQLKSLQREIARFHTSVARSSDAAALAQRDLQRNFINGVNAIQGFSAELRTVKTTAENFTTSLERNKFSMREYFRYAGASTKTFGRVFANEFDTVNKVAVENVKRLQTQYIKMGRDANGAMQAIAIMPTQLDMSNLTTQTQIAAQRQAIFNQLVKQGSTNLLNFGKNTQWAGRQLMVGFTIPLIGLGTAAARTFMQMETATIKFRKVYGDLFTPEAETQQALASIQELGQGFTKFGIGVADTVGLAAEAAAAGFQGIDLQRQVTEATRLQILGQIDQQKALETTISLQNAFRMSSADLADSINFLNAVENQTVVSLDDITTAIPKAAPIVRELGGDVKDLAFFMAAMKEGGINASEGANALKSGLASLINPTDKAKGMLNDMGIDIDNIVESNVGNLKATVIAFAKELDGLSNLQRQRAIEQLFGKFQQARLSALFDNVIRDGNQASRVLDLANASAADLSETAERELGITADSAMNKFRSSVEKLKLSLAPIGETILQIVTPLLDKLNGLLNWFNGLSDSTKKVISKIIFYLGGLAPVILMTVGLMANFIANGIKGLMLLRSGFLKLTGQSQILSEQTNYLTVEQQNAVASAASLEQSHMKLQQAFNGEAGAVRQLIVEYQRMIAAQNTAAARFPGMMQPGFKTKGYANGVVSVPGPKGAGDVVPAMLSPGEAVIPAKMAQRYGGLINGMISGSIPGFKSGLPSIYGGQERLLGPYTMLAPGNTPGGFGLSKEFLETAGFAESLRNTAAVAGSIEANMRLTDKTILSMIQQAAPYTDEITEQLRLASREMAESGQQAKHISELFARKRQQISAILDRLAATGASGAGIASGMRKFAYATNADIMAGGNVRVPGVTIDPTTGQVVRSTQYSLRSGAASRFQIGVQKANALAPISSTEKLTRAHVLPESRVIAGGMRPLSGAGMALPPEMRTAAEAEIQRRSALIGEKLALSAVAGAAAGAGTASPSRKTIPIGEDIARGLQIGMANQIDETKAMAAKLSNAAASVGLINPRTRKPFTATELADLRRVTEKEIKTMASRTGQTTFLGLPGMSESAARGPKTGLGRFAGGGMGAGLGLMAGSMAVGMAPSFPGQGMLQGTLTGAMMGSMMGMKGMGIGAAAGVIIAGLATLNAKYKEHAETVKATFTASSEMIGIFGQKVLDTSLKITTFAEDAKKLVNVFGILNPEIQKLVDQINQLPEDSPVKKLVGNIADVNMKSISVAGNILTNVTDAISTGGLDPANAENYVRAILAAANRTRDFAFVWEIVQKSVGNATVATTKNLNKLTDEVEKNNDSWYYNTNSTLVAFKGYKDLSLGQKIVSDQMLKLFSITSNGSLRFNELMERINGVKKATLDTKGGVIALSAAIYNSGNKDAIDRLNRIKEIFKLSGMEAKMAASDVLLFNAVLQTTSEQGLRQWAEKTGLAAPSFTGIAAPLTTIIREFAKSKDFKDLIDLQNQIINPDPKTTGGGGGKGGIDAFLKLYDKELERLRRKRDALKDINDELSRQNQFEMKQMDLMNQAARAKMTGDYLTAAALQQEAMMEGAKFASESKVVQMDQIVKAGENIKSRISETKNIRTTDRKFLEKLKSGKYQSISPLPTTPSVGFAANNNVKESGSTQMAGGTVYNVTMNVTGGNPDEIATKVIAKIKTIGNKNNKSNNTYSSTGMTPR